MYDRKIGIGLAIGLFIGIIIGVGGLTLLKGVQPAPIVIQSPAPTATPEATATPGPLRIFVSGQVAAADVYELLPGSIAAAAIEAAGGFTAEADTAVVNLAQPLQDGMQIYVPALNEAAAAPPIFQNNVANQAAPEADTADGGTTFRLVNLNTATVQELDTLPGIGPSTAQSIVAFRQENGPFTTIEQVMDVSGIGEAKFAQMKDLIIVAGE